MGLEELKVMVPLIVVVTWSVVHSVILGVNAASAPTRCALAYVSLGAHSW